MKVLKIALLAMALVSVPAFATGNHTCPYGGTPPKCNPKPPDPNPPTNPGNNQGQQQGQGQAQGQAQGQGQQQGQTANGYGGTGVGIGYGAGGAGGKGGNASAQGGKGGKSSSTSGANSSSGASSASGVDASGNSANQIDLSDHSTSSYTDRSSFTVQPNLPGAAPALVAGGLLSMQAEPGCGPLQAKVRIPVRMLVKRKWQEVGYDEDLVPYRDANGNFQSFRSERMPDGSMLLIGNNVTASGTVLGNASSSGFGIAGGNNAGNGQLAIGGGNGQQQIGMRYTIRECVKDFVPVAVKVAPRPVAKKVYRKPVRRAAVCIPRAAKVCPVEK